MNSRAYSPGNRMLEIILRTEGILATVAISFLIGRSVYAMFRAAANRSLGVSYFTALNGFVLMFPDSSYTSAGVSWCKVWRNSWLGAVACFVAFLVVVRLLIWIFQAMRWPLGELGELV